MSDEIKTLHEGIERQHWLDAIGKPILLRRAGVDWVATFDGDPLSFIGIGETKDEAIDELITLEITP